MTDTLATPAGRARVEKLEGGKRLVMQTEYAPAGDQPQAIAELAAPLGLELDRSKDTAGALDELRVAGAGVGDLLGAR